MQVGCLSRRLVSARYLRCGVVTAGAGLRGLLVPGRLIPAQPLPLPLIPHRCLSQYRQGMPNAVPAGKNYGILVYHNPQWDRLGRTVRGLVLLILFLAPVVVIAKYIDDVLTKPTDRDLDEIKKTAFFSVYAAVVVAAVSFMKSRSVLHKLYFSPSPPRIYVTTFSGMFKSKTFGPYHPSIGHRSFETHRKKSVYAVQEYLEFDIETALNSPSLSLERGKNLVLSPNEGADMGKRKFAIKPDGIELIDRELYYKIFKTKDTMKSQADLKKSEVKRRLAEKFDHK